MAELVAYLGSGKGTWGHVFGLIKEEGWEKVLLITTEFFKDKINSGDKIETIVIDSDKFLLELTEDIKNRLKDKIKGTEVALSLISGSGKEHMAILAALLKLGLGIRLVTLTKNGVKEI